MRGGGGSGRTPPPDDGGGTRGERDLVGLPTPDDGGSVGVADLPPPLPAMVTTRRGRPNLAAPPL